MAQSGPGKIRLFYDGFSEDPIAGTAESRPLGDFIVAGQGSAEVDAGVPALNSDALSGVGVITTTNEVDHTTLIGTPVAFDVGLMGTIVAEARVRLTDLDTKEVFFGFSDIDPDTLGIQAAVAHGDTATLTLTASDICGFLLSAELTSDEEWHIIYNGGATTGVTVSATNGTGVDAVAGEWDVLRIEIDTNGTARFYVNTTLEATITGAVSTSVDLSCVLGVDAKTAAIETLDVDYLLVKANRDWTA